MNLRQALKDTFLLEHPADAARMIETIPDRDIRKELSGVRPDGLIRSLEYLDTSRAVEVLERIAPEQQRAVLELAPSRLAVSLLGGLPERKQADLLALLPRNTQNELERLSHYAEDAAGRLMDRRYEAIRSNMTVDQALEILRRSGVRRARSVYVVDDDNRLMGKVDMQAMAVAGPDERLLDLLEDLEGTVVDTAPRKEIVEKLEEYRVDSLPVVDIDGRLLGVVRYQRLFDAIQSVATADMQKMVGASADERALSSAMFSVRRRLPWLHINLLTAFLAAAVVGLFENLIAQFTALAVLLPVVAGQSGNAGSQALAVTMRGLALKEIGTREWRQVLWKESTVGLVDGAALAVTCGLAVYLWSGSIGLAAVIGVAMVLSMVAAGISGALVPIMLTRIGQDPATASSIILTTVTDVAGFLSFLGTATLLSGAL